MSYGCTSISFSPYGDYWRQRRKICALELLSTNRVTARASLLGPHQKHSFGRRIGGESDGETAYPPSCSESVDFRGNHFQYIPFGAGRRICPGIMFGIANVELPLAMLLYHFNWNLGGEEGIISQQMDMMEAFGLASRRKKDLWLVPFVKRPLPLK